MSEPLYQLPSSIELTREEYRQQHAALEAALDLLDRGDVDTDGTARASVEAALSTLIAKIWPWLDELDER